ncbi:MAG: arginase [Acidobacteriota bacterium]
MKQRSHISVIGAPMDLGAGRRGVDMGPSALRIARLQERLTALGYTVEDLGNVAVDQPESLPEGPSNARFLPQITHTCARLADMVEAAADRGRVPVVLGGDHSIATGTIAGLSRHFAKREQSVGVIWIDAHADMNTPDSSPSGNVHGMPLACCIGRGPQELVGLAGRIPMVNPQNVVLVGLRSVDEIEGLNVRQAGVHAFTMRDIDEQGMPAIIQKAIKAASAGTAGFHVSFDMDAVDPQEAPGVGTPVAGGLTYREAHLAMEIIGDSGAMTSVEIVEVNPVMDVANKTGLLGVELIMSALGKRIL